MSTTIKRNITAKNSGKQEVHRRNWAGGRLPKAYLEHQLPTHNDATCLKKTAGSKNSLNEHRHLVFVNSMSPFFPSPWVSFYAIMAKMVSKFSLKNSSAETWAIIKIKYIAVCRQINYFFSAFLPLFLLEWMCSLLSPKHTELNLLWNLFMFLYAWEMFHECCKGYCKWIS